MLREALLDKKLSYKMSMKLTQGIINFINILRAAFSPIILAPNNGTKCVRKMLMKLTPAHDSYLCRTFPSSRPFPTRRKAESNNFVGAVFQSNKTYLEECPKACRPPDHQDWIFC